MSAICAGRRTSFTFAQTALGAVVLLGALSGTSIAEPTIKPAKVSAAYSINFNGMSVGEFTVTANIGSRDYNLNAVAKISLLGGLIFEWTGRTSSSGRVVSSGPLPSAYSFGYQTADKSERIDVRFSDNAVSEVSVNPPVRPSAARVPVTRQHLQNVIDPMSSLVLLSSVNPGGSGSDVCNRRLPIFDGKARYDLQLSYKKSRHVKTGQGFSGTAYICKVKYIPIAGHKPGDGENNYAARNEGIEIWMIPISRSALYVPYYIHIPTPVGIASLSYVRFSVDAPGVGRRALVEEEQE